ncbi:hypothetical protein FE257_003653 [Aspergillus nanangensis]|uniref:Nudix hydrolase domain-containing protein n=1 Tax=Aspergillus nanangensis TaxID=2582783 RepID=A0AAD4GW90_ASPNN|nr:hypothetical protein FE257_003653 [Aspergillus nanangensis]
MEKRAVVSSFIFRFPRGPSSKPDVALFKRSDKVRTYRHHLAPIAGSIDHTDNSPLAAAWRELHEETTLDASTLSLWRTGKPFTFSDASVGREWTVNPFAFVLKAGSETAIHTDWECESWAWYDPQTVIDDAAKNTLGLVPRLTDSLRRVWFEGETSAGAGATLATGLTQLQTDRASGSRELTATAMGVFRDFVAQTRGRGGGALDEDWWRVVRMAAWHLVKNGRESMGAATLSAVVALLGEIEGIVRLGTLSVEGKWDRIMSTMETQLRDRSSRSNRLRDSFAEYLRATSQGKDRLTVMTTSSSSTIRDSLLHAYAALDLRTLEVRILESRPLFEGATLASALLEQFQSQLQSSSSNKTLHVQLYTDASAALAAEDVDILLLGADQISASKGVSNKIGSLPVALSVKHVSPSAKILVLSEVEKINSTGGGVVRDDHTEDNDPMEVMGTWIHDGVKGAQGLKSQASKAVSVEVRNVYFEWVPLNLVDALICEEGVLHDEGIRAKAQRLGELSQRYFEGL